MSGLVSYCDSLDGASIFMEIREDNVVCGGLRTTDQFLVEVCSETIVSTLISKAKKQYLPTCKVSRYCLLALHGLLRKTTVTAEINCICL